MEPLLHENFSSPKLHPLLSWFNSPARWELLATGGLRIFPDALTDFWQRTHYGFRADNGHVLFMPVSGDFEMTTTVSLHPQHQYDQAGLMVHFSPHCWLKTSIEFEPDGPARLGAVVTNNGYSDWSTQNFTSHMRDIMFRITRVGSDFHVHYAESPGAWSQLRIAHLSEAETQSAPHCGLYACSPKDAGFHADFAHLRILQ